MRVMCCHGSLPKFPGVYLVDCECVERDYIFGARFYVVFVYWLRRRVFLSEDLLNSLKLDGFLE